MSSLENCSILPRFWSLFLSGEDQIPPSRKQFLEDQRGEIKMKCRKLSLCGARGKEEEDKKQKLKLEKKEELLVKKQK